MVNVVNGTTTFQLAAYALNPGQATTFPWLSFQAQGWERYKFNRLQFRYVTRVASSTNGVVIMSPDYDPTDAAPTSELQASGNRDTIADAPWKDVTCVLNHKDLLGGYDDKYVRVGAAIAGESLKLYDSGNFFMCSNSATSGAQWGRLWVDYDVTLRVPQLSTDTVSSAVSREIAATSTDRANPYAAVVYYGDLDVTGTGATLVFNRPGMYTLLQKAFGTVLSGTLPTAGGTATYVPDDVSVKTNAAATIGYTLGRVNVTDIGQTVTMNWTPALTTLSNVYAYVSRVGSAEYNYAGSVG
jgi:hypothetical protein